jgi:hypothetical protein
MIHKTCEFIKYFVPEKRGSWETDFNFHSFGGGEVYSTSTIFIALPEKKKKIGNLI